MANAEYLAGLTSTGAGHPAVQIVQTRFRLKLLERWQIPLGARVLEVGCGQGDMTAVLADAVGETGHVTAVDIADPSYGAPATLQESSRHLSAGPLGKRIEFRFNFDVLDPSSIYMEDSFDFVVLAHCSWYFDSLEHLALVLKKVRPWARRLCFSEWDLQPTSLNQMAHMISALIQGQVELQKTGSSSNVRSPFSRQRLRELLSQVGWEVDSDETVSSDGMQDGGWEVDHCLRTSLNEASALGLGYKEIDFLRSQQDLLQRLSGELPTESLPSYAITAARRS